MRSLARALVAAVAVALVVAACTPQAGPQPSPSGWAGAPVAELAATGLTLVGGASGGAPSAGALVVDGSGAAWLAGPWRVVRLDPTSGEATTWDAGDDWAFAADGVVAPSAATGVWLVSRERVRLFDGTRLAADLPFPDDLLRLDDPERGYFLRDALEVGESLWVSVGYPSPESGIADARVVRWAQGRWSLVADLGSGAGGYLTRDADGRVWAGGEHGTEGEEGAGARMWDGSAWTVPGDGADEQPLGPIVADPAGGVWVLSRTERLPATGVAGLDHWDGTDWQPVAAEVAPGPGEDGGQPALTGDAGLAVGPQGSVWLGGSGGVTHVGPEGTSRTFGPDQGVPASGTDLPSVAVVGGHVLARTRSGVVRLEGDRFTPVWTDPAWSPRQVGWHSAASADEAWVLAERPGELRPDPWVDGYSPPIGWARFHDGTWTAVGPPVVRVGDGSPALGGVAGDGAFWATTVEGLVRFAGTQWRVVDPDVRVTQMIQGYSARIVPGPAGSIWTSLDDQVVNIGMDGTRTSIGRPPGTGFVGSLASSGGTVWVVAPVIGGPAAGPVVARWDGSAWATVPAPEGAQWLTHLVATGDGAVWALIDRAEGGSAVGRFADGAWTVLPVEHSESLEATPDSAVCARGESGIDCYDAAGFVATVRVDAPSWGFAIAPDGAVWVFGEQVARLVDPAPGA